jgi:maleylacetate reductase
VSQAKTIMNEFIFTSHPQRVVFGAGALSRLRAEVDLLGARRALILWIPDQCLDAERIAAILGVCVAGVFDRAAMHVPIEVAREARELARRLDADCAISWPRLIEEETGGKEVPR